MKCNSQTLADPDPFQFQPIDKPQLTNTGSGNWGFIGDKTLETDSSGMYDDVFRKYSPLEAFLDDDIDRPEKSNVINV